MATLTPEVHSNAFSDRRVAADTDLAANRNFGRSDGDDVGLGRRREHERQPGNGDR